MPDEPRAIDAAALPREPLAIFFDLDGTLADTAADLAAPVNAMRAERGLPPLPLAQLRPFASMGARGLLGAGLGIRPEDAAFEAARADFLQRYERSICVHTRLFDGAHALLDAIEARGWRWGVVSNKVERYVRPILDQLGLLARSAATVGGDTAEHAKPHPAPLLYAAARTGIDPRTCLYVGDDRRDIIAGRAAGMMTAAAAYGYNGDDGDPGEWGADVVIDGLPALFPILSLR
ncbi:MAG: phosphoglycolate phosphatase [Burkholderiaceae bacterium]